MICPECKAEYRVGFVECSDCHIALVDHLKEAPSPSNSAPTAPDDVVVFSTPDDLEAELVQSLLEGSGVRVYTSREPRNVKTWNLAGYVAFPGQPPPWYVPLDLFVSSEQEELARDVLKDYLANRIRST